MLKTRRPGRLAAAVVLAAVLTAAAVAVPGAAAPGSTAPPRTGTVSWSGREGPVAGALTPESPALATITFPAAKTADRLLFWTGPRAGGGYRISVEHSVSLSHDKWSPPQTAGKAITTSAPSAAPYLGDVSAKFTTGEVIVAWTAGSEVQYEIGTAEKGGTLSFGPVTAIPGARASGSPAVFSPLYSRTVLVTWKAAGSPAIDYVIGSPGKGAGPVSWGPVGTIPGAEASSSPAVAEASTGSRSGRLYVFWRVAGRSGRIGYATAADPLAARIRWTRPAGPPSGIRTGTAPAAQAIGPLGRDPRPDAGYPLLIVYRAPRGSRLMYVTLPERGPASAQRVVPSLTSQVSPALFSSVLAGRDPGQVFYLYTRPCGGC